MKELLTKHLIPRRYIIRQNVDTHINLNKPSTVVENEKRWPQRLKIIITKCHLPASKKVMRHVSLGRYSLKREPEATN